MRSGEVIGGRFEIEQLAGEGGMGAVYRARDRRSGSTVAVKVLHETAGHVVERFAREANETEILRQGLSQVVLFKINAEEEGVPTSQGSKTWKTYAHLCSMSPYDEIMFLNCQKVV